MTEVRQEPPGSALRAAIYLRQSLDRDGEGLAVERQLVDCRALAGSRGWDVVEVVTDNSVSASTGKDRTGYLRVLELIRTHAVDRIVVWHIDRLYRSMIDLEHLVLLSEHSGVRIATVTGDLDLATDMGRMLARILAAVARGEIERKSARQKRANQQRREAGAPLWIRRPFGLDRVDGWAVIVPAEAQALRQAVDDVLAGTPLAEVARRLNATGLATTAGGVWSYAPLKRTLLSPRYVGQVAYLGDELGIAGTWPTLWDDATRTRLAEILTDPRRNRTPTNQLVHWLSGAMICGVCSGPVYAGSVRHSNGARAVYECRDHHVTRVRGIVEDVVEARLLHRLADPAFAPAFDGDRDLAQLRATAADRRRARDDLAGMLADGLIPVASARPRLELIRTELEQIEGRLAAAASTSPVATFTAAADPAAVWAGMTPGARRGLLQAAAESVTLLPLGKGVRSRDRVIRSIEIAWRVQPK